MVTINDCLIINLLMMVLVCQCLGIFFLFCLQGKLNDLQGKLTEMRGEIQRLKYEARK